MGTQAHCFTLLLPVPSPLPTLTPTVITSNHSVFMAGCPGCAILAHWPQKAGQSLGKGNLPSWTQTLPYTAKRRLT